MTNAKQTRGVDLFHRLHPGRALCALALVCVGGLPLIGCHHVEGHYYKSVSTLVDDQITTVSLVTFDAVEDSFVMVGMRSGVWDVEAVAPDGSFLKIGQQSGIDARQNEGWIRALISAVAGFFAGRLGS